MALGGIDAPEYSTGPYTLTFRTGTVAGGTASVLVDSSVTAMPDAPAVVSQQTNCSAYIYKQCTFRGVARNLFWGGIKF